MHIITRLLHTFLKQNRHRKNYTNPVKDAKRMANFLKADAVIEEHNSNPDATFQLEYNELSDLVSWAYSLLI